MLRDRPVASFFVLAYAFSWIAWAPLVLQRSGLIAPVPPYLHLVGGLGPLVAATCMILANGGAKGLRSSIVRSLGTRHRVSWLLARAPRVFVARDAVSPPDDGRL